MRKLIRKSLEPFFAVMLIALTIAAVQVHTEAAEAMQDEVKFILTTDKKEYASGEKIAVKLDIQNNSGKEMKNALDVGRQQQRTNRKRGN